MNFNLEPIITSHDSILINSFPSFNSSCILFTLIRLLLLNKNINLKLVCLFVILSGWISEIAQLFFSSRATFDLWDMFFVILGSYTMEIIFKNFLFKE